ncbi:hypothetical protein, partial [Pseudomonas putida]|uniref:hypothetical protein n=1 Tax=Pseudomonas putida TaxID=303 RepID=UPI00211821D1
MALRWNDEDQHSQPSAVDVAVDLAFDVAFDLAFDLDLDLRDFRRLNAGLAEAGDGHGCPSSAEAPGWGLRRGPAGSKAGVREPRSAAQGPDDGSAAFFGYFLSRLTK